LQVVVVVEHQILRIRQDRAVILVVNQATKLLYHLGVVVKTKAALAAAAAF
jgi:hypothetical protein